MQGKRDAFRDHGESVPSETSILNILALATDKISGEKLSSQQIVAQSQTFILAGATPQNPRPFIARLQLERNKPSKSMDCACIGFNWLSMAI